MLVVWVNELIIKMGQVFCRSQHEHQLNDETLRICTSLFTEMDLDHHKTLDISEARTWWKDNYSVINARALFESVDANHDGVISFDEWVQFWTMAKNCGHSDEEIQEELINISNKNSWIILGGMPRLSPKIKD